MNKGDKKLAERKCEEAACVIENIIYSFKERVNDRRDNIIKSLDEHNIYNIIESYDTYTMYDYFLYNKDFIILINNYIKLKKDYDCLCIEYDRHLTYFEKNDKDQQFFYCNIFRVMKYVLGNKKYHEFIQKNEKYFDIDCYIDRINNMEDIIEYDFFYKYKNHKKWNFYALYRTNNIDLEHAIKIHDSLHDTIDWTLYTFNFYQYTPYNKTTDVGDNLLIKYYKNINWKLYRDIHYGYNRPDIIKLYKKQMMRIEIIDKNVYDYNIKYIRDHNYKYLENTVHNFGAPYLFVKTINEEDWIHYTAFKKQLEEEKN